MAHNNAMNHAGKTHTTTNTIKTTFIKSSLPHTSDSNHCTDKEQTMGGSPHHPTWSNHSQNPRQNINMINTDNDFIHWQALAQVAINMGANILTIQETNIQWNSRIIGHDNF